MLHISCASSGIKRGHVSELLKIFNWIRINEQTLHSRRSPRGSKFLLSLSGSGFATFLDLEDEEEK